MIKIVDSLCGTGKTSYAIQMMNNNLDRKYIYVTPYLDEVKRIKEECDNRNFYEPNEKLGRGKKMNHFIDMIKEGNNIVSTHALFLNITEELIDLIKENNYTLILDEVMNVIEKIQIDKKDLEMLQNQKIISVDEKTNRVIWNPEIKNYKGRFVDLKNSILHGDVYLVRNSLMMWTFPVSIFECFKDIYIMTYLFKGQIQCLYYDMYNIPYEYKSVRYIGTEGFGTLTERKYELCDYHESDKSKIKDLIEIYDNPRKNKIGKKIGKENPLSSSWFDRQVENNLDGLTVLKNNIYYFFTAECKSKSKDNMWTVFVDYEQKCKGKGYSKGFIPFNKRATNDYRHKKNLAYCVNLFMNPIDKGFFTDKGVAVNEDIWALSELVQWIFRSQLRDDKPIRLYIPSERMRNLLIDWLNN